MIDNVHSTNTNSVNSLDALTGLRWVAALIVFAHHAWAQFGLKVRNPIFDLGLLACLAVSFFFVLSGFILTYVYHRRMGGAEQTRLFWFTRWARIWPLHATCLVIFIALFMDWSQLWISPNPAKLVFNGLLLQSWFPYRDWSFTFNVVSWTISVEAFFYLLFPWLVGGGLWRASGRFGASLVMALTLIALLCYWKMLPSNPPWIDIDRVFLTNPLLRLPEFCLGILVGHVYLKSVESNQLHKPPPTPFLRDSLRELICVGLLVAVYYSIKHFALERSLMRLSGGGAGLSIWVSTVLFLPCFALLLYVFANSRGLLGRLMSSRMLVFLGEVSFAFYMIHNPVILYFKQNVLPTGQWSNEWLIIASFSVAIGASVTLFKGLEMPAKKSLLGVYQRRTDIFGSGLTDSVKFCFSRIGLLAATLMLWPAIVATVIKSDTAPTIRSATDSLTAVQFDQRIELLDVRCNVEDHDLVVTMVWNRMQELPFFRYLNLYNQQGVIVGFGPDNSIAFKRSSLNKPFVDQVKIPLTDLDGVASAGISFVQPSSGLRLVASEGYRTRDNTNLIFIGPRRMNHLLNRVVPQDDRWIGTEVNFGGVFSLLGYRLTRQDDVIHLELNWQQRSKTSFRRYLHLCDAAGSVISQGRPHDSLFADFVAGKPFIDQITIPLDRWQKAEMIGVGFYNPETNRMLSVSQQPTSMSGFRYNLIDGPQIRAIFEELSAE